MPDAAQMDLMGFRFRIGDVCQHRGAALPFPVGLERVTPHSPARLVVNERIVQQCHGGVQLLYRVTAVDAETGHLVKFPETLVEHELEPYPAEHPEGTMLEAYETISDLRRQLREAQKGPQPGKEP